MATEKLVNKNRLAYFWGKITSALADKASITLSTTDIGEGEPLAANTLYGVYE